MNVFCVWKNKKCWCVTEMATVEFVVAKYEEDVSWVAALAPHRVTVYDKGGRGEEGGGRLPNVGREAHTFAHHVVERYDTLADVTVFLQGRPFDHMDRVGGVNDVATEADLRAAVASGRAFERTQPFCNSRRYFERTRLCNRTYALLFDGEDPGDMYFSDGAQWVALRGDITCRPRAFYERLRAELSVPRSGNMDGVVNPWTVECMWQFIFDPRVPLRRAFFEEEATGRRGPSGARHVMT